MKRVLSLTVICLIAASTFAILPYTPATTELATEANDYKLIFYDGHMHTVFSDASGTVSDIVATAKGRGLDAVIITDHSENLTEDEWNWLVGNCSLYTEEAFLCLPGFEMTGRESILNRDHFVVYNVSTAFVTDELAASEVWPSSFNPNGTGPFAHQNITNWVDWVHDQGGIAIHAHPSGHTRAMYGVDLIEILNQNHIDEINAVGVVLGYPEAGYIINNLALYGERDFTPLLKETLHSATELMYGVGIWFGSPEVPLNSWDSFLLNFTVGVTDYVPLAVANTDSHNTGDPDSKVGIAKTGVYVSALTPDSLYTGIKKGRSFVTTGPTISFNLSEVIMGETLFFRDSVSPTLNVKIESSTSSAKITKVGIIKNGNYSWQTFNPNQTIFETQIEDINVTTNSYYRVEVEEYNPVLNETHFAYSNPIFVKSAPPLIGDLNYDGVVDIFDVVTVSVAFGSKPGDPTWNQAADTNNDDIIDIFDVVTVTTNFGKTS